MSINKALSGTEVPLKVKHARVAIIGTFHSRGAHSFWAVATRQPLQVCLNLFNGISSRGRALILFWKTKQENRITAWKFCYLLHKVLREGHPLCCQHSMRHRELLSNIGKLWVTFEFPLNFACEQTSLTTLNIENFRVI